MKNLLKYILLSILALVLYDTGEETQLSEQYKYVSELQVESLLEIDTIESSSRTDFYPPRQLSSMGVPRVQSTSRRNDSPSRHNFEYVKSGKIISSGVKFIAQNKSSIQHSSFMDPGHKLVSLCRFII